MTIPCWNCHKPINVASYDDIPDEDVDLTGDPGSGNFKAWYTCPHCRAFSGVRFRCMVYITGYDVYDKELPPSDDEEDGEEDE